MPKCQTSEVKHSVLVDRRTGCLEQNMQRFDFFKLRAKCASSDPLKIIK